MRLARLAALAAILAPAPAAALPAVLVGAAPMRPRSHNTHLVVVQDGERTTMALQFDVLAVPMDLMIVLPIHGEIDPGSLKTLDRRLFERLDHLAAPRLEHVWEQDPCAPSAPTDAPTASLPPTGPRPHPATFSDGEYDFAVLGRVGAGELETWLRALGFPMYDAHHAALAEHFAAGAQFVVARVDRQQVHFNARGHAVLSPFRVSFVADPGWRLPLRAGLLHADGAQDLVIHGLARGRRLTLDRPTAPPVGDLDLTAAAADRFPAVHAAVSAATRAHTDARALVEHAAPLAPDALAAEELTALGVGTDRDGLVLSRVHLHHDPTDLVEDPALSTTPHDVDLHARYLVRHPWTGATTCDDPRPGVWGPPIRSHGASGPLTGVDADVAPRLLRSMARTYPVADLGPYLAADVPALGLTRAPAGCSCATRPAYRDVGFTGLFVLALRRRRSAGRAARCE